MDFYSTSARVLDVLLESEKPKPLKPLCVRFAKNASPGRVYALLAETLKYLPTLKKLLKAADILKNENKVLTRKGAPSAKALALVVMHDLLFSKKGIALPKGHKVRDAVEKYSTR